MELPSQGEADALELAEVPQVLRYWLASIRLEEALAMRPRARRDTGQQNPVPSLDGPVAGQDYFRLPMDESLTGLLFHQQTTVLPLDGPRAAFFEGWLLRRYRSRDEEDEGSHQLCVPTLMLPRGELCGLLRIPVRLSFLDGEGQVFAPPQPVDRKQGRFPPPPVALQLEAVPPGDDEWPCFIDTRLLHHTLGVTNEAIDAFYAELRGQEGTPQLLAVVQGLCSLLQAELETDAVVAAQDKQAAAAQNAAAPASAAGLAPLLQGMQALLRRSSSNARAYPTAIVIDGSQARTTWHLQRELKQLLESDEGDQALSEPLAVYLTGRAAPMGRFTHSALGQGPALTASQRDVAEAYWGSVFTAVQGPPGTGKTTLIQHLCAEFLVKQVEMLADRGGMGAGPLVLVSSNNRAVDNALEPLVGLPDGVQEALPVALRAGNRQVSESVLAPQLRRVSLFLENALAQPKPVRAQALTSALEAFKEVRAQVQAQLAPRSVVLEQERAQAGLRGELAGLADMDAQAGNGPDREGSPGRFAAEAPLGELQAVCGELRSRLEALAEFCDGPASAPTLAAVARQFATIKRKALPRCLEALETAGRPVRLALPPPLPPSVDPQVLMDAWLDGLTVALAQLEPVIAEVEQAQQVKGRAARRSRLEAKLAALGDVGPAPEVQVEETLQRRLFEAAVQVREAWAREQAEGLAPHVKKLLYAANEGRALFAMFRGGHGPGWSALMALFGVWGSTLLSLGNCFPAGRASIARLIIDEAGQCHPVHAVSGLLRAQSALVIGDVHQLAPVLGLGPEDDRRALQASGVALSPKRMARYRLSAEQDPSVQRLADEAVERRLHLVDHFRCQPEIIALCDTLCDYGLRVHTHAHSRRAEVPALHGPLLWDEVCGEQERSGGSWSNELELQRVLSLLSDWLRDGLAPDDIALITPYRGQLERFRQELRKRSIPIEGSAELAEIGPLWGKPGQGLALGTVHRFQGGERSVVLFSCVVSKPTSLRFLNESRNLLNVAVSRAKHHFVGVGRAALISQGAYSRLLVEAAAAL